MTKKPPKIVDARGDKDGDITHVKLEGRQNFMSVERAIPMADKKQIDGVHVVRAPDKKIHLRTNPDGRDRNNLDYMVGDI